MNEGLGLRVSQVFLDGVSSGQRGRSLSSQGSFDSLEQALLS